MAGDIVPIQQWAERNEIVYMCPECGGQLFWLLPDGRLRCWKCMSIVIMPDEIRDLYRDET